MSQFLLIYIYLHTHCKVGARPRRAAVRFFCVPVGAAGSARGHYARTAFVIVSSLPRPVLSCCAPVGAAGSARGHYARTAFVIVSSLPRPVLSCCAPVGWVRRMIAAGRTPGTIGMHKNPQSVRANCQRQLAAKKHRRRRIIAAGRTPGTIGMRKNPQSVRANCQRRLAAKKHRRSGASVCQKTVIASQSADWCGNPFSLKVLGLSEIRQKSQCLGIRIPTVATK